MEISRATLSLHVLVPLELSADQQHRFSVYCSIVVYTKNSEKCAGVTCVGPY